MSRATARHLAWCMVLASMPAAAQSVRIVPLLASHEEIPAGISLSVPPGHVEAGKPYAVTAVVAVASGNPNGYPVILSDGASGRCTAVVQDLVATCTLTSEFGDRTLKAEFPRPGDFGYASDQFMFRVRNGQSLGFTLPPAQRFYPGKTFALDAAAGSGLAVSFTSLTPSVCSVLGATATIAAAGLCRVAADQAGNNDYVPAAQLVREVPVAKARQFLEFSVPDSLTVGATLTLSATARYADEQDGGGTPLATGLSPVFSSLTPTACSIDGSQTLTILTTAICRVVANQSGDASHQAAPAVERLVNSGKGNQSISFTAPGSQGFAPGASFVVTASASSGLPVGFAASPPSVCSVSGETGTATVSILGAGDCTITASQPGSANFEPAPVQSRIVAVLRARQDLVIDDPGPQYFGPGRVFEPNARSLLQGSGIQTGLPVSLATRGTACQAIGGRQIRIVVESGTCTLVAYQTGSANVEAVIEELSDFLREVPVDLSTTATGSSFSPSQEAATDAAGRYLIYRALAGGESQLWRLDSRTGAKVRVDVDGAGTPISQSTEPAVSGDGQLALFVAPDSAVRHYTGESKAAAEARRKTTAYAVILRNLVSNTSQRVGNALPSGSAPQLAPDGLSLVYSALNPGTSKPALYRHALTPEGGIGDAACITCAGLTGPADGDSGKPVVSDDGRYVAFESTAKNLAADPDPCPATANVQLYVRDLITQTTQRIARPATPAACTGTGQRKPSLAGDGRKLVFESDQSLTPDDTNAASDVYFTDLATGMTKRLSRPLDDSVAGGGAEPRISGDGDTVAFVSAAPGLDPGHSGTGASPEVHLIELDGATPRTLRRLDRIATAQLADGSSARPVLDRYGQKLLFDSTGGNAVTGVAANAQRRVFQMAVPSARNQARVFDSGFE